VVQDPARSERFIDSQWDYIEQKDYKQLLAKVKGTALATPSGVPYHLNVKARSLALQAVMFSIAVQYGPETSLVREALGTLPDPSRAPMQKSSGRFTNTVTTWIGISPN
jgi:hypothetical protein